MRRSCGSPTTLLEATDSPGPTSFHELGEENRAVQQGPGPSDSSEQPAAWKRWSRLLLYGRVLRLSRPSATTRTLRPRAVLATTVSSALQCDLETRAGVGRVVLLLIAAGYREPTRDHVSDCQKGNHAFWAPKLLRSTMADATSTPRTATTWAMSSVVLYDGLVSVVAGPFTAPRSRQLPGAGDGNERCVGCVGPRRAGHRPGAWRDRVWVQAPR